MRTNSRITKGMFAPARISILKDVGELGAQLR
jgi:hypothetical protein